MKNSILVLLLSLPLIGLGQDSIQKISYPRVYAGLNFGYLMPTDSNSNIKTVTPYFTYGKKFQVSLGFGVNVIDSSFIGYTKVPNAYFEWGFNANQLLKDSDFFVKEGILLTVGVGGSSQTQYVTSRIFVDFGAFFNETKTSNVYIRLSRQFDKNVYLNGNRIEIGLSANIRKS